MRTCEVWLDREHHAPAEHAGDYPVPVLIDGEPVRTCEWHLFLAMLDGHDVREVRR